MDNYTLSTQPRAAGYPVAALPHTFRLPTRGRDPYFGLTRAYFYWAEAQGLIRLLRLRGRGKKRGVTLVETAEVLRMLAQARNDD